MDKTTRTLLIIGSIITFVIVPVAATLIFSALNQPAPSNDPQTTADLPSLPERSQEELADALAEQSPELIDGDGNRIFAIFDIQHPEPGWYIVKIRNLDDPDATNPAKVLVQDTGILLVLLGPGTTFPIESTRSIGVPDAIAEELNQ
jgi:hypothetical protein